MDLHLIGLIRQDLVSAKGHERFSSGHELRHDYLAGHVDAVIGPDGNQESRAGFISGDRYEI